MYCVNDYFKKTNTTFPQTNVYKHTADQLACKWITKLHLLNNAEWVRFSWNVNHIVGDSLYWKNMGHVPYGQPHTPYTILSFLINNFLFKNRIQCIILYICNSHTLILQYFRNIPFKISETEMIKLSKHLIHTTTTKSNTITVYIVKTHYLHMPIIKQ